MTLSMPIISVCCDRKLEFYLAVLAPNDNLALCQLIVWISSSEHVVVGHVGAVDLNTLLQNLLFVLGGQFIRKSTEMNLCTNKGSSP